ncbi:MAG: CHAD domain-containing protein [Planctomycetes bacterium]|nr:CHAD domain-containing protein [Planctomycetota bacterium]
MLAATGGKALLERAAIVLQGMRRLRERPGVETVHKLRVATRRLRGILGLCASRMPRRERRKLREWLREATQRLGSVRSLDVSRGVLWDLVAADLKPAGGGAPGAGQGLAGGGVSAGADAGAVAGAGARSGAAPGLRLGTAGRAAARALRRQFAAARPAAAHALWACARGRALHALLARLAAGEPPAPGPEELSWTVLRAREEVDLSIERLQEDPSKNALHAARIALKKYRYKVEALALGTGKNLDDYLERLRLAQTALGDLHDMEVVLHHLELVEPLPGVEPPGEPEPAFLAVLKAREAALRREGEAALAALRQDLDRLLLTPPQAAATAGPGASVRNRGLGGAATRGRRGAPPRGRRGARPNRERERAASQGPRTARGPRSTRRKGG